VDLNCKKSSRLRLQVAVTDFRDNSFCQSHVFVVSTRPQIEWIHTTIQSYSNQIKRNINDNYNQFSWSVMACYDFLFPATGMWCCNVYECCCLPFGLVIAFTRCACVSAIIGSPSWNCSSSNSFRGKLSRRLYDRFWPNNPGVKLMHTRV
jgi:hypothetical protein